MRVAQVVLPPLLAAVLAGCATGPAAPSAPAAAASPTPPPRIRVDGALLTWAGSSPFTGAVVASSTSRSMVVQITQLPSGGTTDACIGVRWRPVVQETAQAVTMIAAGYAPAGAPSQCVDGLDAPVPLRVPLDAPLGSRRLVDGSDGRAHPAFDASRMPTPSPSSLPAGVQRQPVRWDERTRVALRRWQTVEVPAAEERDVWISQGSAAGIAAGAPVPSRASEQVAIGSATGRLWHGGGPYDVVVIRFPRGAEEVEVRTVQAHSTQDTVEQALRIARSLT